MIKHIIFSNVVLSLTVALSPLISYALSPINSTQDGQIIKGGSYYNTGDSRTTFVNTASGDLWLQGGTMVRGQEVNSAGNLTNNGGNILLSAPGHVVRVDGAIDVSGLINGQGAFLGNGGTVTVNSTYLFQNGNIFAQGANGGHVQFNVNSATIGSPARIDATGAADGRGGAIRINATGVVDIKEAAALITNGIPGVDSNVIEVTGGLVNNEGLIAADGFVFNNSRDVRVAAGGAIRLVSQGNIDLNPVGNALNQSTVFTPSEGQTIFNGIHSLAVNYDASIRNIGYISSEGRTLALSPPNQIQGDGGSGGNITLTASKNVLNMTTITADGGAGDSAGNGGQIAITGNQLSQNNGDIRANGGNSLSRIGRGGDGGHITLNNLNNTNSISAYGGVGENGGDGGIMDLSQISNSGAILAHGGAGSNDVRQSLGGLGGIISATDFSNATLGTMEARGGAGLGSDTGIGGGGGVMILTNYTNNGDLSVDGGVGGSPITSPGGNGGRISGNNVINAGILSANGGDAVLQGGDGGAMTFNRLQNRGSGLIRANGGNTFANPAFMTIGGNGGIIKGSQVFNSGTVQAQGGIGNTNGEGGKVRFF